MWLNQSKAQNQAVMKMHLKSKHKIRHLNLIKKKEKILVHMIQVKLMFRDQQKKSNHKFLKNKILNLIKTNTQLKIRLIYSRKHKYKMLKVILNHKCKMSNNNRCNKILYHKHKFKWILLNLNQAKSLAIILFLIWELPLEHM